MNRRENIPNYPLFGLHHTSVEAHPYRFSVLDVNNSQSNNDDGALLLNVRFIPSTEDLYRKFCRFNTIIYNTST